MAKSAKKVLTKIINVASIVLSVIFVIILVTIIIQKFTGELPSVFGYRILQVQTDSMDTQANEDTDIEVGDAIWVKRVSPSELNVGDVISYRAKLSSTGNIEPYSATNSSLTEVVITHRIIAISYDEASDTYTFRTQGDKQNSTVDPAFTQDVLVGKMLARLDFIGAIYSFFTTKYGFFIIIIPIVALIIYEILAIRKTLGEARKEEVEAAVELTDEQKKLVIEEYLKTQAEQSDLEPSDAKSEDGNVFEANSDAKNEDDNAFETQSDAKAEEKKDGEAVELTDKSEGEAKADDESKSDEPLNEDKEDKNA